MAERSFKEEVEKLRVGAGTEFRGEGILAVTKALLQSGVAYVGGYQGAPITHLMDVFADGEAVLAELGVHFEQSASEAAAASMLAASVNYPLRGAVTWKSTVGTNVASDALANVASAGVKGGALIIVGEDYGEGASIMQERSHAFAMKSQMWLLDPRPNLPSIVAAVEHGFELSEASATPVMLELRIRACHVYGRFQAKDNRRPAFSVTDALDHPTRQQDRIILPPYTFEHEREKLEERWPNAVAYIRREGLNEHFPGTRDDVGIIVLGGLYNTLMRGMERLGLADIYGDSQVPIYCMNVAYPVIDDEVVEFCAGKAAVLVVEEGQPEFIEQAIAHTLRKRDVNTRLEGKGPFPKGGELTGAVMRSALTTFFETHAPDLLATQAPAPANPGGGDLATLVPPRPPSMCTGCPERPFFTAMKLLEREVGPLQVSADIGCHSFVTLAPFNLGNTITGYGLGPSSGSAFSVPHERRAISVMGDGGFWHNGLNSGITNAVENQHDSVIVVVDNGYSAATGGQWIPSSKAEREKRQYRIPIVDAVRGVGVKWAREVRTYDIGASLKTLREAMSSKTPGPKVIVAQGECQLNRQRRIRPRIAARLKAGKRHVRERFGIDDDVCTGDHSCIRLSGCPSLSIKDNPDPLRPDPVASVLNSCVGCGVCGEVAHAAVLCPSFFKAEIVHNPNLWDRLRAAVSTRLIDALQRRRERRAMELAA